MLQKKSEDIKLNYIKGILKRVDYHQCNYPMFVMLLTLLVLIKRNYFKNGFVKEEFKIIPKPSLPTMRSIIIIIIILLIIKKPN